MVCVVLRTICFVLSLLSWCREYLRYCRRYLVLFILSLRRKFPTCSFVYLVRGRQISLSFLVGDSFVLISNRLLTSVCRQRRFRKSFILNLVLKFNYCFSCGGNILHFARRLRCCVLFFELFVQFYLFFLGVMNIFVIVVDIWWYLSCLCVENFLLALSFISLEVDR